MTTAAFRIASICATRLDIPLIEPIRMSFGTVRLQNIVIVRLRDQDGGEGVGEATVMGGPHWGGESAEAVKAAIEHYVAPVLIGTEVQGIADLAGRLRVLVKGNAAARAALEMAALDLIGKRLGVSAFDLLGGACRTTVPVAWTLSTGSVESDIAEGERALAERGHTRFKLKLTAYNAPADVARATAIIEAFRGRASVIADVNQAWDSVSAARYLPQLAEAGLEAIEQPMAAGDLTTIADLRRRLPMHVMADEAITGPNAALAIASAKAASCLVVKPNRDGGITASQAVAAIGVASGQALYGGTMLESSLATAASLHLYATLPSLELGSELFGPSRLVHDIVTEPLVASDGVLALPTGPGLGVTLDEDRIAFLARQQETGA